MRVTITGASGLIGSKLVHELTARGDEVTVLSRSPDKTRERLKSVAAVHWDPIAGPAPTEALAGRDAVVHLAGENVAQRWSDDARRRIRESREVGTRNLVTGIEHADAKPATLVSSSAVGYYGPHGDEKLDEDTPAGSDFLAQVCIAWEQEADRAAQFGLRVVNVRTGVVLDKSGGALSKMLPPFKLGAGGPVAGGKQYMPWIHVDDVVGIYLAALDTKSWSGPVNAAAPEPVTNKTFSHALGKALHRPAIAPIPGAAIRLLYGDMAEIVTKGQRVVPRRTLELGYRFQHPDLDEALASALR
jgi:uncharacterized protein (TIGR01777 family)